jgi:hypothetical protein
MTPEQVAGRPVVLGGGDVVAPFFLDWIPRGTKFSMVGVGLKYEEASVRSLQDRGTDLTYAWYRNRIDVELAAAGSMKSAYIPDIVFSLREHEEEIPPHLLAKVMPSNGKPTISTAASICRIRAFAGILSTLNGNWPRRWIRCPTMSTSCSFLCRSIQTTRMRACTTKWLNG